MRSVTEYRKLAPFSMEDLVESANALLRDRPRLEVSSRTVRYYISQRLLPPPEGPPRLAKYTYEHLLALIAIRGLQDRGVNLDRIGADLAPLWEGKTNLVEQIIEDWLGRPESSPSPIAEPFHPYFGSDPEESPRHMREMSRWSPSYAKGRRLSQVEELRTEVEQLRSQVSQIARAAAGSRHQSNYPNSVNEAAPLYSDSSPPADEIAALRSEVRELAECVRALTRLLAGQESSPTPPDEEAEP